MASRPNRAAGGGHDQGGGLVGEDRVQDVLSICPSSMGSGLQSLLAETDSAGRLRVRAVARIKLLLEQVKQNIKVRARPGQTGNTPAVACAVVDDAAGVV